MENAINVIANQSHHLKSLYPAFPFWTSEDELGALNTVVLEESLPEVSVALCCLHPCSTSSLNNNFLKKELKNPDKMADLG